jgi:O-antigen/teichoic acid export membrane protein
VSAIARHMARSMASNLAGQVLVLAAWFALTPFIVHELGASEYGLWVLVASFVAYGDLLDLGVGTAVTKYVAEHRTRGESDEASASASALERTVLRQIALGTRQLARVRR